MNTVTATKDQTANDAINLFEIGCLVSLNIGTWSGRKMLTKADYQKVGIDPSKLPEEIVNYGRKLLVPRSELRVMVNIEQLARKYLSTWSVPFGIANAHFVPVAKLPDVEAHLKEFKTEFESAVDSFVTRFEQMKQVVQTEHPEFWEKCLKAHYPGDPESLRDKFRFRWFTFKIAGMSSIQEANVGEILAKQKADQERLEVERQKMKEGVEEFVAEYVTAMRQETIKFCDLVTARVNGKPCGDEEKSKKLTGRSLVYFRKYVDRFRQMNIFGDAEVEKMLAEFRETYLDGAETADFESGHVQKSVTKALSALRQKATEQGEEKSEFIASLKRKIVI